MLNIKGKLAIFCGGGDLPKNVVENCKKYNIDYVLFAIKGVCDYFFVLNNPHVFIKIGKTQEVLDKLYSMDITNIVFAGYMSRPSLFSLQKPDELSVFLIKKYLQFLKGDDNFLSFLIDFFEERNFKVLSLHSVLPEIIVREGVLYANESLESLMPQIENSYKLAKKLGELDIGQALVYQQNRVIAVEGVEGTKNLIERSKKLLYKKGDPGFLVKVFKPKQTDKIDMPCIGDKTIKQLYNNKLVGVVLDADSTIIINVKKTVDFAKKYNIFMIAIKDKNFENN